MSNLSAALIAGICAVAGAKLYRLGTNDYFPYTYRNVTTGEWTGFGVEMARMMSNMCDSVTLEVEETSAWNDCWRSDDSGIGDALANGTLDACITYTHTHGIRNVFADFGWAILGKAAGLLARLDHNGMPLVSGFDDLSGKVVIDVSGTAPTPDTLELTTNKCTGRGYSNFTLTSAVESGTFLERNTDALRELLGSRADVVYMYADQAKNIIDQCRSGRMEATSDCALWAGFGTKFAYIQTGKFGWARNGTTLIFTRKGSCVDQELNPCTQAFMESREYYHLCLRYPTLYADCYRNSFFPLQSADDVDSYQRPTDELLGVERCASGYCPCQQDAARSSHAWVRIAGRASCDHARGGDAACVEFRKPLVTE